MSANITPLRRVLPIAIGILLSPAMAPAAKKNPSPPPPPTNPLLPAAPSQAAPTNLSTLPAPSTLMLPAPGDPEFEFGGPPRPTGPATPPATPSPTPTNEPAPLVAAPTPATPPTQTAQPNPETDWITADEVLDAPLVARVTPPPDSVVVAGLCVCQMKVELWNRSADRVVAIRGVRWLHGRGRTDWVKSLSGRSRSTPAGMVVVERGPGATEIWFEHGLILPGESLRLNLPLTPQSPGLHALEVDFAAAGGQATPWKHEALISVSRGTATEIFDEPNDRTIQTRAGQAGTGLLRSSLTANATQPEVTRLTFRVGLPLARGNWLSQLTGGLGIEEAFATAGLQPDAGYLAYYVDPLRAWIITRPSDRDARIVMQDEGKWVVLTGCRIDAAAPDLMCAAPDQSTPTLLDPATFAGVTTVQTPWIGRLYNPGKTYLKPDALRAVLRHASERSIPVRVASIDPNGLGIEEILTVGVTVDAAGRWLKPSIVPAPQKAPNNTSQTASVPRADAPLARSSP